MRIISRKRISCYAAKTGRLRTVHPVRRAALTKLARETLRAEIEIPVPFLDHFATRDKILKEWAGRAENMGASRPPRIVSAIILATRGEIDRSRELLVDQARQATTNPGHKKYVAELAAKLGLGVLSA